MAEDLVTSSFLGSLHESGHCRVLMVIAEQGKRHRDIVYVCDQTSCCPTKQWSTSGASGFILGVDSA